MVCLASEGTVIAIVRDTIGAGPKRQSQITLAPSKSVSSVFAEICADFHYEVDEIELLIQYSTGEVVGCFFLFYIILLLFLLSIFCLKFERL